MALLLIPKSHLLPLFSTLQQQKAKITRSSTMQVPNPGAFLLNSPCAKNPQDVSGWHSQRACCCPSLKSSSYQRSHFVAPYYQSKQSYFWWSRHRGIRHSWFLQLFLASTDEESPTLCSLERIFYTQLCIYTMQLMILSNIGWMGLF